MRSRFSIGRLIIFIGIICVGYSSVLFVQNQLDEKNAKEYSATVVEQFMGENDGNSGENDDILQGGSTISIDDELYIGVLEIPSLDLVLPVQSEWSYAKLKNTPCAYTLEPFIIAAHNYDAHFGRIKNLEIGDQVIYTDVNYDVWYYKVEVVEILNGTDVLEMLDTEYDLTLFTCNYNNNTQRVVVRLNIINTIN